MAKTTYITTTMTAPMKEGGAETAELGAPEVEPIEAALGETDAALLKRRRGEMRELTVRRERGGCWWRGTRGWVRFVP